MVLQSQDAWRKHPLLINNYKRAFPGLKTAFIIFAAYCVAEGAYKLVKGNKENTLDFNSI